MRQICMLLGFFMLMQAQAQTFVQDQTVKADVKKMEKNVRGAKGSVHYIDAVDGSSSYILETLPLDNCINLYGDFKQTAKRINLELSEYKVQSAEITNNKLYMYCEGQTTHRVMVVDIDKGELLKSITILFNEKYNYRSLTGNVEVSGNGEYMVVVMNSTDNATDVGRPLYAVAGLDEGQLGLYSFKDMGFSKKLHKDSPVLHYKSLIDNDGTLYVMNTYGELLALNPDGSEVARIAVEEVSADHIFDMGWDEQRQKVIGIRVALNDSPGFFVYDNVADISEMSKSKSYPLDKLETSTERQLRSFSSSFINGKNGELAIRFMDKAEERNGMWTSEYSSSVYLFDKDRELVKTVTVGSSADIGFVGNKLFMFYYAPKYHCEKPSVKAEVVGLNVLNYYMNIMTVDKDGNTRCIDLDSKMGAYRLPFSWGNYIFDAAGGIYVWQ